MNRILQCRKVLILAPRRFFHPKRVGKISKKEILVKIHSLKEAGKNLILNHKIAFLSIFGFVYLAIDLNYKINIRGDSIIWSFILDEKIFLEPAEFAGVLIKSFIVSIVSFQRFAEWAGSSQKRIKQLRVRCVGLCVVANVCYYIGLYIGSIILFRNAIQSSE